MDKHDALSDISSEDRRSPEGEMRGREINAFFKDLFHTKLFSDVKFIVGGRVVEAHRIVLSTFSSYFKTMFNPESKFEETAIGEIKITDFEYDVVLQMLEYVYTGAAPKLLEMPVELMRIADKYNIKVLQSKCSKVLIPRICVENALEMLVLADQTNAESLEGPSLTFIKKHYEEVRSKGEWRAFCQEHGSLLEKITDVIANYPSPKKRKLT